MSDNRHLWAYLNRVIEGPHPHIIPMINKIGVEELVQRIKSRRALPDALLRATEARYAQDFSAKDLDSAHELGYRLITPEDTEWPSERFLAFSSIEAREQVDAAPHALWVRGAALKPAIAEAVSIVGTRAATKYGLQATAQLAAEFASEQIAVVSGGALGIDAKAHSVTIGAGGITVAVAACGPGVNYPSTHTALFEEICIQGCIISEYPPGTRPARHRFLTRNRLVAALSDATAVVEAGWRSGARNTANWATKMGRHLAAIPGPITSPASTGCHDLVRQGQAVLCTNTAQIRELYRPLGEVDSNEQLELDWAASAVQKLSRNELQVYDSLPISGTISTEAVASHAGLTIGLTTHLLLTLQKVGLIERVEQQWARI